MRKLSELWRKAPSQKRSEAEQRAIRKLSRKGVLMIASLSLAAAVAVIGGVAWYTRVSNISGLTLDVAGYDVRANYMNGKFSSDAEDYLNVQLDKAAPGTIGCLPVQVTSNSEVGVTYSITLDLKGVAPEILERVRFFYYDRSKGQNELCQQWYLWKHYQENPEQYSDYAAADAETEDESTEEGETTAAGTSAGTKTPPTEDEVPQSVRESYAAYLLYQQYLADVAAGNGDQYGEGEGLKSVPAAVTAPTPTRTYLGGVRYVYEGIYATGKVIELTDAETEQTVSELHYYPGSIKAKQKTDETDTSTALGYVPISGALGKITVTAESGSTEEVKTQCCEYIYWEWVYEFDANECYNLEDGTWGVYANTTVADTAAASDRHDRIDTSIGMAKRRAYLQALGEAVKDNWYDTYTSEIDPSNFTKESLTVTDTTDQTEETISAWENAMMVKVLVTGAQATPLEGAAADYVTQGTVTGRGTSVYIGDMD